MKVEIVNTLESNRPQYRLGDAVLCRDRPFGKQAIESVASSPQYFNGTILYEYAQRIERDDPDPQWEILREIVAEKSAQAQFDRPGKNELVVHLRLGDRKGFKLPGERLVNYLTDLVGDLDSPVSNMTIVTAIHFGKLMIENHLSEEQLSVATGIDRARVNIIVGQLRQRGQSVRVHSSSDIDRDFCFLAHARRLVLGNGHFSLCAAMVSDAECHVPPWARGGARLDIEALLDSRPGSSAHPRCLDD